MLLQLTPRAHERIRIRCRLTIGVQDRSIWARAVEMSGAGAMVESFRPVAVGSEVQIHSRVDLLAGKASVRYCQRHGLLYRIGLEFARPVAARF